MIKKHIVYYDFDGQQREDDFYFSLNQVQLARINRLFPEGLEEHLKLVTKNRDANELFRIIDILVSEAYGERQGNNFVKVAPNGQKLSEFFTNTDAYDKLLTELMDGENKLIDFLTGCLSQDAQVRARSNMAKFQAKIAEGATPQEAIDAIKQDVQQ